MKFFSLIKKGSVHLEGSEKVVDGKELSELMSAKQIIDEAKEDAKEHLEEAAKECEKLKEEAIADGFEEGICEFSSHIALLEEERAQARAEMTKALLPLTMVAIRKILGHELEVRPETIVDIVATALKRVAQHRKVTIYVRRVDIEEMEKQKPRLRELFDDLQSLSLSTREDIQEGSCVIETEKGILNVSLDLQLKAIEEAFEKALKKEESES